MSRKSYDAFCEKFDEMKRRGLNNWDAFEGANQAIPAFKDLDSFKSSRTYHRKKNKK